MYVWTERDDVLEWIKDMYVCTEKDDVSEWIKDTPCSQDREPSRCLSEPIMGMCAKRSYDL